jgi:AmmeMemoRadiSam system protein B
MVTRSPVAAGSFYEDDPNRLGRQITKCFEGAGLPGESTERKLIAAIVPHAGFKYSGKIAAYAYKALAEAHPPKTIILIGPSHKKAGTSASIWQGSAWETPLGELEIDYELGRILVAEDLIFNKELDAHQDEHSLEVQLPFIQALWKTKPKILPISVSADLDILTAKRMGEALYRATVNRDVFFVISSDFTHYGINYGYFPFFGTPDEVENQIHVLDHQAIKEINRINPEAFIDLVKRTKATICGAMPIAILLNTLRAMKIEKGKLLKYATSAEVTGDKENSVSYAAIVFEK